MWCTSVKPRRSVPHSHSVSILWTQIQTQPRWAVLLVAKLARSPEMWRHFLWSELRWDAASHRRVGIGRAESAADKIWRSWDSGSMGKKEGRLCQQENATFLNHILVFIYSLSCVHTPPLLSYAPPFLPRVPLCPPHATLSLYYVHVRQWYALLILY